MPGLSQLALFDVVEDDMSVRTVHLCGAVEAAADSGAEARGAVFTRAEVVAFILDLVGYSADQALYRSHILEPSFGDGDFLFPIIDRLLSSWKHSPQNTLHVVEELRDSVRAVELHRGTFVSVREDVITKLEKDGIPAASAEQLADSWLVQGDFLLEPFRMRFDYVVGNPPYVRQELIPSVLLSEYRRRYKTVYDRADLYVPFLERSLSLLNEGGSLGFICADRWMKNRYGGPLRKMVSESFHLKAYVDMTDTAAFRSDVSAYPAITLICREKPGSTRIALRPEIESGILSSLATALLSNENPQCGSSVREISGIVNGMEPWLLASTDQMTLIRRVEKNYPSLEEAGCAVGIGVATGADDAFIAPLRELDVEPDRKLPLVTTRDIESGEVVWRGLGVINPFADDGRLVDLSCFPRLKRYVEARKEILAGRHCARKVPSNWYRTIDRIWPELTQTPKLLIPDIKGEAHIVFEPGKLYPHHNLYYVTSETWDLRALQAVLLSAVSRLFIATYSTKMRGGYLRFQAQYLRRIHIPFWRDVPEDVRQELGEAAVTRDMNACNAAVFKLYGLDGEERSSLGGNGE